MPGPWRIGLARIPGAHQPIVGSSPGPTCHRACHGSDERVTSGVPCVGAAAPSEVDLVGWDRLSEEEALEEVTSERGQLLELLSGLDSFGHN